ncbi:MAG TPA: protein-L-isoaspartate(D-aspartate) O-methyltransferase [Candidatus Nanoarchaeia archaeon]|nr:protein-L-isoaspartate(D-aspartate) O-methyltransferase [Candidatus Nanoarchaeia archaeon]
MNKEALLGYWRDRITERTFAAFTSVPREEFLLAEFKMRAYEDTPLPILRNKTISQPSTVLMMTDALDVHEGQKILEIGTGSGYQSAMLAMLVGEKGKIVSVEVIPELVTFARENLRRIGVANTTVVEHDGSQGYGEHAPYDRIIFTAASPQLPLHLLDQLKPDGIMVVPVGDLNAQNMMKLVKLKDRVEQQNLGEFLFSPLVGKYGFDEDKVM